MRPPASGGSGQGRGPGGVWWEKASRGGQGPPPSGVGWGGHTGGEADGSGCSGRRLPPRAACSLAHPRGGGAAPPSQGGTALARSPGLQPIRGVLPPVPLPGGLTQALGQQHFIHQPLCPDLGARLPVGPGPPHGGGRTRCLGPGWLSVLAMWLREGAALWPGVPLGRGKAAWEC